MKTPQTPDVIATRNKVDELLQFVPEKPYPDCTPSEKARFDEFRVALEGHRVAVRQARSLAAQESSS